MSARSKSTTTTAKTAKSYDFNNAMSSPRTSSPFLTYPSAYTSDPFPYPYSHTASHFSHRHPSTASCVPTAAMCDYPFASTSGQCGGGDDDYSFDERAYHRAKASTSANMYGGHSSYDPTAADMMMGGHSSYGPTSADMYGHSPYGPTAADMYGHSSYDPTSANMYGHYGPTAADMAASGHSCYGPTAADMYSRYDPTAAEAFVNYRGSRAIPYGGTSMNFLPSAEFAGRMLIPGYYSTTPSQNPATETFNRMGCDSLKLAGYGMMGSMALNGMLNTDYKRVVNAER